MTNSPQIKDKHKLLALSVFERFGARMYNEDNRALKYYLRVAFDGTVGHNGSYCKFDIIIQKDIIPYAIIEVIDNIEDSTSFQRAESKLNYLKQISSCRFGILTDNTTFYFCDYNIAPVYLKKTFEEIVEYLIEPVNQHHKEYSCICNLLESNHLSFFADKLQYDKHFDEYMFCDKTYENDFFSKVLNEGNSITHLYRYTSLDTLISILNNRTYRICGIAGMNDKSEINYFDDENISTKEVNSVFLSSFSSLQDDLTMWRLYGNDGEGVCLDFEVSEIENFHIAKVNYAENNKLHTTRDLIKSLQQAGIKFQKLKIWKHFFKPEEYKTEKEIRLIYIEDNEPNGDKNIAKPQKTWIKTWSHSIIIPALDFNLMNNRFPLKLRKIILGPKLHEPTINQVQIEEMLSQKKIQNVEVEISGIRSYR